MNKYFFWWKIQNSLYYLERFFIVSMEGWQVWEMELYFKKNVLLLKIDYEVLIRQYM